jgi:ABC-2 type transport system permease protein
MHAEGKQMKQNNKYLTLARREFWEHRGLWLAPTVVAGLLLLAALFGAMSIDNGNGVHVSIGDSGPRDAGSQIGAVSLVGLSTSIGLFAAIVGVIYLLDCLFAERKDRSILFWKSLPTSDAETVLTKLGVALVLLPALVMVLAMVLQPLLAAIAAVRFAPLRPHLGEVILGSLAAVPHLVGLWMIAALWYAPLATYLMLASVLARRTPIIYAVIPPVALGVAERMMLGTNHVFRFVGERLLPWPQGNRIFARIEGGVPHLSGDWWKMFGEPGLWLGVIAAGALAYAVIRLRRYRDDT